MRAFRHPRDTAWVKEARPEDAATSQLMLPVVVVVEWKPNQKRRSNDSIQRGRGETTFRQGKEGVGVGGLR